MARAELSKDGRQLGIVTFWRGALDFEEIEDPVERDRLARVFRDYGDRPFTFAWGGFQSGEKMTPLQHEPKTLGWFHDVVFFVLVPDGYRCTFTEEDEDWGED